MRLLGKSPNLEDYSVSEVARKIVRERRGRERVTKDTRPTASGILVEAMRGVRRSSNKKIRDYEEEREQDSRSSARD